MKMFGDIPVWGEHEEKTLRQIETCPATADRAGLMADGHLGYAVPIDGVVAYKDAISPSGVQGDELRAKIGKIMDDVWSTLSFGVERKNSEAVEHEIFDRDHAGWDLEATRPMKRKAENQLGTIGPGNHYVDLFTDEQDRSVDRGSLRVARLRAWRCDVVPKCCGREGRHGG